MLVVIQLSGGNDGLNTVVPYHDERYHAARPKLGIAAADVLKCNDQAGFHPSLSGVRELLDDGRLTVVQGVGYDNPNRSHFESMDIWHTCRRKEESRPDGWLGRYLDAAAGTPTTKNQGGDAPALHLGREEQPFAVASQSIRVPTVRDIAEFELRGRDRQSLRDLLSRPGAGASTPNDLLDFLQSSTTAAMAASDRVTRASLNYLSDVTYPASGLGQKLRVVAQLIDAGLSTKVYYVVLDGFDTHSQQPGAHAVLLKEWSDAMTTLIRDLEAHGHADRVCVMTFSEFGRRVAENASDGTDHGAAGPMFLAGGGLKGGMFGSAPDLSNLQNGDLQHEFDFRQVYATVLQDWLGVDFRNIVGDGYETLPLFKA